MTMNGEKLLEGAGSVSHQKAIDKATSEYRKYQQKTLSDVEKAYLESLKEVRQITEEKQ